MIKQYINDDEQYYSLCFVIEVRSFIDVEIDETSFLMY